MRPAWSGYVMTCFCCITGTTIIYSVHEHVFESPWLCDVNQETDIVHWLYFDYICSQIVQCPGRAKIESMEKCPEAKA